MVPRRRSAAGVLSQISLQSKGHHANENEPVVHHRTDEPTPAKESSGVKASKINPKPTTRFNLEPHPNPNPEDTPEITPEITPDRSPRAAANRIITFESIQENQRSLQVNTDLSSTGEAKDFQYEGIMFSPNKRFLSQVQISKSLHENKQPDGGKSPGPDIAKFKSRRR